MNSLIMTVDLEAKSDFDYYQNPQDLLSIHSLKNEAVILIIIQTKKTNV